MYDAPYTENKHDKRIVWNKFVTKIGFKMKCNIKYEFEKLTSLHWKPNLFFSTMTLFSLSFVNVYVIRNGMKRKKSHINCQVIVVAISN